MFFSCKLISVVYCFFWFLHMVSFFHAYLVVFDNDMLILLGILFVGFFFKALNKSVVCQRGFAFDSARYI